MVLFLLVIIVFLFTIVVGIILMRKGNSNSLTDEKMTDDVSTILEDNSMDEEII